MARKRHHKKVAAMHAVSAKKHGRKHGGKKHAKKTITKA